MLIAGLHQPFARFDSLVLLGHGHHEPVGNYSVQRFQDNHHQHFPAFLCARACHDARLSSAK